jgi:hypothetical protein
MAITDPVRVEDALSHFPYPGSRGQLMAYADRTGADEGIMAALRAIPARIYRNSAEVMRAVANDTDPNVP